MHSKDDLKEYYLKDIDYIPAHKVLKPLVIGLKHLNGQEEKRGDERNDQESRLGWVVVVDLKENDVWHIVCQKVEPVEIRSNLPCFKILHIDDFLNGLLIVEF